MKIPLPAAAAALLTILASAVQGELLLSDDFESYTAGANLDSSGPWATVQFGANPVAVLDEATATPFGTPNQYLSHEDNSGSSIRIQTSDLTALSGGVTTFAFDFEEPSTGGSDEFLFGYSVTNGDLTSAGARIMPRLDDGTILGLSTTGTNTYSLDTPYRLYVVFNDGASTINYLGGPLASETADLWIEPVGGPVTFVGTRSGQNSQTASYRLGFRGYGGNTQHILLDNVTVHEGIAVPGATPTLVSTTPADDDNTALVDSDLVATFDMPVSAGTGNITLKLTSDDSTVATFDVTNPAEVTFSGATFTVDPPGDLAVATGYYVEIDSTAVVNCLGEAYDGILNNSGWNFMTAADATPPAVLTLSPADDATGVAVDSNLVVTFDEDILAGSGNIVITNDTEGSTFATIDVTDGSQVTVAGATLTIDPAGDLTEGRTYTVEIAAGSVTDLVGNPFEGILGTTDWNFQTPPDTINPSLVSTSPADDADDVFPADNLVAIFDESVQAGTGDITILNLTNSTTLATIAVTDGSQVSFAGNTMTVDPAGDLDPGQYAIQIDAGAVTDFSANTWAGIVSPDVTSWNFTTYLQNSTDYILGEDEAVPGDQGYYTDANSNVVGVQGPGAEQDHRNVVLGFILPVLPVGETAGSVDFRFEITAARDTTGGVNLPGLEVHLLDTANPDASGTDFYYNGGIGATELVGTTAVAITGVGETTYNDDEEDRTLTLSGDALALFQSFYGGDHIPDQPEAFFRFNLDQVTDINDYKRYRIDLDNDESGIDIIPVLATPPALAGTSPADDATAVFEAINLVASFDQAIRAGTGDIVIKNLTDATTFATIPVGDAQVTISGNDLIIDPAGDLDSLKDYAVQIDAGAVEDLTGQAYAGILDDTTWSFTTGTTVVGTNAGAERIIGRAESGSTSAAGYYPNSGDGRIGIGGPGDGRQDQNMILYFTLPTLPAGTTLGSATIEFQIEQGRNHSGADPDLNVYLLDSTDPSTTGTDFFYHGPGDPDPGVAFVGAAGLSNPAGGQIDYDPDIQQTYTLTGDALVLLQGLYGGDNVPDQTHAYFRFNLDNFINDNGDPDNDLDGATFDRYFIGTATGESALNAIAVSDGSSSPYDSWASDNSLSGGDALETTDVEVDGLVNLLEFGFGTDPNVSDNAPLAADGSTPGTPIVQFSGGGGGVTFDALFVRRKDHGDPGSVTYTVQFSGDLVTFFDSSADPDFVADVDADYEVVKIPHPVTLPNGQKARFFRVVVTRVP